MAKLLGTTLDWQSTIEEPLTLNESELHIWWLPLSISSDKKDYTLTLLSERQLEKYHRRSTPELQESYLAGRYFLITLLAKYSNCKPTDISLDYNRLNKPSLKHSPIEFNFTDTSIEGVNIGLLAFCLNQQVGVDLEACSRVSEYEQIARRRFSKTELDYVQNENGSFDRERCLAIWTRKEAYGKAIGKGINFQMNQRNLVNEDFINSPFHYNFNDGQEDWRLLQIQPETRFIGTVVHQSHQELLIKAFNRPYQIA